MNENHCALYRPKLQRFADGELGAMESRDLRAHLLDCVECRAIVGGVYSMRKFFAGEPLAAAPAGFAARVAEKAFLEGPRTREERTVLPFAKKVAAIAAAIVLLVGGALFLRSGSGPNEGFEARAESSGQIGSLREKLRKLRAKDGAREPAPAPEDSSARPR